jgi:repressor LexA
MKGLTGRQQEILDLIRSHIKSNGLPPTRADIARIFGFKSPNAAEQHLRAIEKKGFISILAGASRGIVLNQDKEGIPIIGLVAAGQPILAEENITDKIQVPQNMFRQEADYLLRVKGNSMIDLGIHEDDLIAVKKENDCKNGQIVVARLGDEVTVKTFKIDGEGSVTLEPANEDYSAIEVDPQEGFHLEGICIGVIKSF